MPMMTCDAKCLTCYYEKGRRSNFGMNDIIWFCPACKRDYFCEIGLTQGYDRNNQIIYSCPHCNTLLKQQEVDKIIIAKSNDKLRKKEDSHELYQKVMNTKEKTSGLFRRRKTSEKTITELERSQISELTDNPNLSVPIILEIAKSFYQLSVDDEKAYQSPFMLLNYFASKNTDLVPLLYSSICQNEDTHAALIIRFTVFCHKWNYNKIDIGSKSTDDIYDIRLSKDNEEILVFCSEKHLDVDTLEAFLRRPFSLNFKDFPKVTQIFFVAKSFSYVSREMIKKYHSALTARDKELQILSKGVSWEIIPLRLWKEKPHEIEFIELLLK
ncbi:hypothetical protein [Candidatus Hodarchaeum mangrovi]